MSDNYAIWADGASSGTLTGPAGAAFYVKKNDEYLHQGGKYLDGSNNEAELTAILLAVRYFREVSQPEDKLMVIGDSQWSIYCLAAKLDHPNLPHYQTFKYAHIFDEIVSLWDMKRMRLMWVRREENTKADGLSKKFKMRGY